MYCPDQQSHPDRLTPVTPKKSRIDQHVNLPIPAASFRAERGQTSTLSHSPLLAPECAVARVTTVSVCLLASAAKEPTFCSRPHIGHSREQAPARIRNSARTSRPNKGSAVRVPSHQRARFCRLRVAVFKCGIAARCWTTALHPPIGRLSFKTVCSEQSRFRAFSPAS